MNDQEIFEQLTDGSDVSLPPLEDSDLSAVSMDPSPPDDAGHVEREQGAGLRFRALEERYSARKVLGRGGMGEVMLWRDHTIGRDVAMKSIRMHRGTERRFVREARVQGQLEHPAIVPVYDVGMRADGALYFTMKRVRGASLAEVLRSLHDGDKERAARYSRRRLLTLFSSVCMAVHYAHQKGVVHRDLKPSNVMMGDFGEVYLLDWGLAALRGAPDEELEPIDDGLEGTSRAGSVMGTPGYMAPEQIERPSDVDARADVYALGVMLFELLTLESMHRGKHVADILVATLGADGPSPAAHAPDAEIPPELDRLCREATRRDPASRLPSAEALSQAIESYLDGDRDAALRRALATGHAVRASEAFERAASDHGARALAMRDVTAALGLDPDNQDARRLLVRLIAEPPETVPLEAEAEIAANYQATYRFAGRTARLFYFSYLLYLPLMLWMGVKDWGLFALGWATIAGCALATHVLLRRPTGRLDVPLAHLAISMFTVGVVSVLFGPFILVPMLAVGNSVAYISSIGYGRGLVPIAGCLAVLVPAVLGWVGVTPAPYSFENGQWIVTSRVFFISPIATPVFLLAAIFGTVGPACLFVGRLRKAYSEAERKLQLQAWQLRQIVPDA